MPTTATSESWRLLTIVFVDIVGSTPLSVVLEGEDYVALIDEYQAVTDPIMEAHGGFLGRDEGDGRFIWFGWPRTAEDDAERAVRMALELNVAMQRLARQIEDRLKVKMAVRIGLHTGEIIVREFPDRERPSLLGAAANVAAKVQAAAEPGSVCISEATAALVSTQFDLEPAGRLAIDGLDGHLELSAVLGEAVAVGRASPLFGRHRERSRLADLWRTVREGKSASVLLTGEAGIGKSQLVAGFLESYALSAPRVAIAGDNYRQTESFGALNPALGQAGLTLAPDLTDRLHDVETRDAAAAELVAAIKARAAHEPLIVLVEDAHWLDHSTSELLSSLAEQRLPGLFLLVTSRLTAAALQEHENVTSIGLGPLVDADLSRLVRRASPDLDEDLVTSIVAQSAGNPFFASALVAAHSQGTLDGTRRALLPHSEVPIVVQQALRGQLDRSDSASSLAITAAVIGREFRLDLLRRCHEETASIDEDLAWLQINALVDPTADPNLFRFRHALVQQLAYDLPVRAERQIRHSLVADGLVALGVASPALLGIHFDRAGRHDEAIVAKLDAARGCRQAGAFHEGLDELDRALELIEGSEGSTREHEVEALELRAVLSAVVDKAAYGANALDRQRLTTILAERDDPTALARALTRDWASAMVMSELRRGGGLLRKLAHLARGDAVAWSIARMFRGTHMMYRGNFRYAEPLLRSSVLDLAEQGLRPHFRANWSTADDPVSVGLSRLPPLLWIRGQFEEAKAMLQMAEDEAATIAGPAAAMSVAHVKANSALFFEQIGDGHRAVELGAEIAAIGKEPALAFWEQNGRLHQLIGGVQMEPTSERLEMLLEAARGLETVARLFSPMLYLETARGHLRNGDQGLALEAIEGAEAVALDTGAMWLWSEACRLRAACTPSTDDARRHLTVAALSARRQGARVYELRALADLIELDRASSLNGTSALLAAADSLGRFPSDAGYPEVERLVELLG